MAKYRLVQDNEEIRFATIPDFKDLKDDNLKDIIKFTGFFKNVDELKGYLNKYNLIKTNRSLTIKYRFGGKDKTLRYGVSYKDDLKFFDIGNMVEFIRQNRTNINFLETLCNHYRNTYTNGGNLFSIRNYIDVLKRKQVALDDQSEIVENFNYAISDFVSRECFRYDRKKEKSYPNFKGMRDLAMFLSSQTKKDDSLTTYNMDNTNEFIEYYKNKELQETEELVEEPKVKTKKKNKNDFPGQMSFIINNGNVDI